MADGDLQSIISGLDPTAAMQLQALQGQNIAAGAANPANWQGQGIFGGLARQIALGQGMAGARDAVSQVVNARVAAQPDLAAALAASDPFQYAAANPGMNPIARAQILQSTPEQVAATRNQMADAAYRQAMAQFQMFRTAGMGNVPPIVAGRGAPTPAMPGVSGGGAAPPIGGGVRLPPANVSPYGSGRYGDPALTATPDQGTAAPVAALGPIPPPGPQRMQWLARLTPAQRAALLSRLPPIPGGAAAGP